MPVTAPGWLAIAWYPALGLAWRRQDRRAGLESAPPDEVLPLNRSSPRSLMREALAATAAGARVLMRPTAGLVALAVFLVALTAASMPDGQLHLIVLDVGQGDSILVMTPSGSTMLIDGGPDPDLLLRRLGERLPWWHRRIDILILTHPHQDHVAGLVAALERYEVGLVLDTGRDYANPTYPRFLTLARSEPGGRLIQARTGQRLRLDAKTTLTLLYPTPDDVAAPLPEGDINNASVVALLRFGSFTALLTGDAHIPVEEMLADRGLLTRIDVLKVGHHGSHSSTGPLLLAATDPRVAIISCGIGNAFGHPHQVTLDHLQAVPRLRLHRTDLEGSIEVTTDGLRYQVRSRLSTDPWRSVVAAPITANRPARSIGAWPFPPQPRPSCCLPPSTSPTGSSPIRVASVASLPRRRASSRLPGSRSIRTLSRSPPCCTT
jgi:competence protein ComEC